MTIEGIGDTGSVPKAYGTAKRSKAVRVKDERVGDEVRISAKARRVQEGSRYIKFVKNLPDVREGKVREAKIKVERGDYLTREMAGKVAESLLKGDE